jgi:hypothetical protein
MQRVRWHELLLAAMCYSEQQALLAAGVKSLQGHVISTGAASRSTAGI